MYLCVKEVSNMKKLEKLGLVLLGIWLIATGVFYFIPSIAVAPIPLIAAILAIAAGVLIIL
jgi:hypothetical protein